MAHQYLRIHQQLSSDRDELLHHPLYSRIDSLDSLRTFMEFHIFAVWDFMSLLKGLQRRLSCVDVPWIPHELPLGTRLVNEIVLGEESDEDGEGGFASHFDLYRNGMQRAGAPTTRIDGLIARLQAGQPIEDALVSDDIPDFVAEFVTSTFQLLQSDDLVAMAAGFTFGREDLLPDVFQRIVDELNISAGGRLNSFRYYLDRHIELDGDQHGPMAERLLCQLCGEDPQHWATATTAAREALQARRRLWDGISTAIVGQHAEAVLQSPI